MYVYLTNSQWGHKGGRWIEESELSKNGRGYWWIITQKSTTILKNCVNKLEKDNAVKSIDQIREHDKSLFLYFSDLSFGGKSFFPITFIFLN